MRFSLQTLFVAMAFIAIFLGYYTYGLREQGRAMAGFSWSLHNAPDALTIAPQVREGIRALPGHTLTNEPFEISKLSGASRQMARWEPIVDRFYCHVQLSDGSKMDIGFWIYQENGSTGVSYVALAHDSYLDGPANKRRQERQAIHDLYDTIMIEIQNDLMQENQWTPVRRQAWLP